MNHQAQRGVALLLGVAVIGFVVVGCPFETPVAPADALPPELRIVIDNADRFGRAQNTVSELLSSARGGPISAVAGCWGGGSTNTKTVAGERWEVRSAGVLRIDLESKVVTITSVIQPISVTSGWPLDPTRWTFLEETCTIDEINQDELVWTCQSFRGAVVGDDGALVPDARARTMASLNYHSSVRMGVIANGEFLVSFEKGLASDPASLGKAEPETMEQMTLWRRLPCDGE